MIVAIISFIALAAFAGVMRMVLNDTARGACGTSAPAADSPRAVDDLDGTVFIVACGEDWAVKDDLDDAVGYARDESEDRAGRGEGQIAVPVWEARVLVQPRRVVCFERPPGNAAMPVDRSARGFADEVERQRSRRFTAS